VNIVTDLYLVDLSLSEIQVAVRFSLMPSSVCIANYNPDKTVALIGYLLFYLIAPGKRAILQSETPNEGLGYVFDDDGVHEVFKHHAWI